MQIGAFPRFQTRSVSGILSCEMQLQGGAPETGLVGTVSPGSERGTGTVGTACQELKPKLCPSVNTYRNTVHKP